MATVDGIEPSHPTTGDHDLAGRCITTLPYCHLIKNAAEGYQPYRIYAAQEYSKTRLHKRRDSNSHLPPVTAGALTLKLQTRVGSDIFAEESD